MLEDDQFYEVFVGDLKTGIYNAGFENKNNSNC